MYELHTGQIVKHFLGHSDDVKSITLSQSGKYLLSGSDDCTAILWSVNSPSVIVRYTGPNGPVLAVDMSVRFFKIATGSEDSNVYLFDL